MTDLSRPSWKLFQNMVRSASREVFVCSPYITAEGVDRLFDALPHCVGLRIFTRFSPGDWASGASDPESILALLQLRHEAGCAVELFAVQRLHAKLYSVDRLRTVIGSANLTEGGFRSNIELVADLRDAVAAAAVDVVEDACERYKRAVNLESFGVWIEESRDDVIKARANSANEPETLSNTQARLDQILGLGANPRAITEPVPEDLERFAEWLDQHRQLPEAEELLERHRGKHQLSGHVRQSFFGGIRFFREYPRFIEPVARSLEEIQPGRLYVPASDVAEAWINHLDEHAQDVNPEMRYSYPTLRGYLTPHLGGTRSGGGGGDSTFKRLLPLVARYLTERGR